MRRSLPAALSFALALAACQGEATAPARVGDAPVLPEDNVLYGVHHVMTKNGVRSSVLDADSAYAREESNSLDLMGVRLSFYTETGVESGTLTSKTGTYNMGVGEFNARDSVVLVTRTPNGTRRIATEALNYNLKTDMLSSDLPFVMTEGGRTTRGSRFRSEGRGGSVSVSDAETSGGLPQGEGGLSF